MVQFLLHLLHQIFQSGILKHMTFIQQILFLTIVDINIENIYLYFLVATIYLTIKGIEEQQFVQFIAFLVRFIVMILIIITCIVSMLMNKTIENDDISLLKSPPLFIPEKFNIVIPIICFALGYQVQIPTVSKPVNNKSRNLLIINISTILTCSLFYNLIAIFSTL